MKREDLQLYFIMGTSNVPSQEEPIYILEKALQAGITMFQFREKGPHALTGLAYEQFARQCQQLCHHYNVPFIINDDVDLAIRLGADGVHIGQDDLPVGVARKRIGNMILGVSVHSEEELQIAMNHQADYVGIGPIFPTSSKSDAQPPCGTSFLQEAHSLHPELPIVAIGGINFANAHSVFQTGVDGVAVISAICQSKNVDYTVATFKSLSCINK
ncbi:thiamine phosphate synthase [Lysinibacillus sp. OL1_EC]|uniref:thiamine phosphate synthase n=1 Tax=unclassified Lysinibacillus TaxID=2636778 RepID=UPI00103942CF|nr:MULTISPECIES: thiamine phosphate synthase [unclassified Lysinibacillus]MCM0625450.1 thiamine phosphate synthase [Lysinibacillus sp. OL1_EC]TBV87021.1 thiamine phosphate synthase [Lysinibacillus sp. OL1]UKJ44434.1 thiamine phosphate synthase [Lysinibacillus sp. ACHW1.5]WGT41423.1 thiamine phosphate synthase [Lysinibacillus sp. 1 U-2021]